MSHDGRVWMYWEDPEDGLRRRAPYLDLCHESVRAHLDGLQLQVIDRDNVFDWLPDLDRDRWERLPGPVSRSDYARIRLVHRHGGAYLDFDCIVMSSLRELLAPLERAEVVGWGRAAEGRFYNNLFAARAGAPFLGSWMEAQDAVLDGSPDWDQLRWAALGQLIAKPLVREFDYCDLPTERIAPVMWFEWRRFLSRLDSPDRVLARRPITVMLWNKVMGPAIGGRSADQVRNDKTLLARLFRIALGESTVDEESSAVRWWRPVVGARFSAAGRGLELRARRLLGEAASSPD